MRSLFFCARHGETFLNQNNFYRGWSNGPDAQLNENGVNAAHEAGVFLKKLNQKFSKIIASPLDRAQLTAAIIASYLGIKTFEIDERLRPLNVGDLAGTPKDENPIDSYLRNTKKSFPNGESISDFERRQYEFAQELLPMIMKEKSADDPEVLVVAHTSNVMYWWNVQSGTAQDEYLNESRDILEPGGVALISEYACLPVFKANRSAEDSLSHGKNS